ncbi:hypothetical protein [Xanthomonas sp. 3498]|uniref:hypothetical protein n=1 Tax=Xanthomonas sp. 3498 TaxID=2663863 RepID=UPI0017B96427|nr:hypothetical protein [Xanthomonas sp. 3498]MBB5875907.1 hypothetical protein [Xanthomonas sp. 3498]
MAKIAQQIAQQHNDTTTASEAAESLAIAKDQIWNGEGYTIYVFDDNSFLAQSGPTQVAVDADDQASVDAYVKWLGADASHDQQRIDEMLAAFA